MPVRSQLVGRRTDPVVHDVDARWIMAHAASVGDLDDHHLDTTRPGGVIAHPLFAVCLEWPAVLAARRLGGSGISAAERARGVHATHDLVVHRPVRAGDRLATTAVVEAVERRRPGAYEVLRLETVDEAGEPVVTTRMGSLFLGVDVDGDDRPPPAGTLPPGRPAGDAGSAVTVDLPANLAHTYTECARIWNPIHTDVATARAAGLPGPILHGTATLAVAVSALRQAVGAAPPAVRRATCRFAGMVQLPASAEVLVGPTEPADDGRRVGLAVRSGGHEVVADGVVVVADRDGP